MHTITADKQAPEVSIPYPELKPWGVPQLPMGPVHATRETWLQALRRECEAYFRECAGVEIPAHVRLSCGWPSKGGTRKRGRVLGQCFTSTISADKHFEIFVSPIDAESLEVAAVIVHELVHAAVGIKEGHKGEFKRVALAVGLVGKMTCTTAGDRLAHWLAMVIGQKLGRYPHGSLKYFDEDGNPLPFPIDPDGGPKQGTRMHKIGCLGGCGWIARASTAQILKGLPVCSLCEVQWVAL